MKDLHWSDNFATGIEVVDLQHHYFVDTINRVAHALNESERPETRERLLLELVKYAEFHFLSEENVAEAMNAPLLAEHRERHREILAEIGRHVAEVEAGAISVDDFVVFLIEWFAGHTIHEDRRLLRGHPAG
ncbi:bacteriohemerythrin [Endothiovibrio diazotrophicus]